MLPGRCPWGCGTFNTDISLQGHIRGKHLRGRKRDDAGVRVTPDAPGTLKALKQENSTLKEENAILQGSKKQRELLTSQGLLGKDDAFDRRLSQLLKTRQLDLLDKSGGGDSYLLSRLDQLQAELHSEQLQALGEKLKELEDANEGRSPTEFDLRLAELRARGETQQMTLSKGIDAATLALNRFGGRVDELVHLLVQHLAMPPPQPGVAIRPSYTPEQYAEMERALVEEEGEEFATVVGEEGELVVPEPEATLSNPGDLEEPPEPDVEPVVVGLPEKEPPPDEEAEE